MASELRAKYDSTLKSAAALYLDKQFQKAIVTYNEAVKLAEEIMIAKPVIGILKYMICCCLHESNTLEDLAEVVNVLQTMDKSIKRRFPAAICLLALTHCKLFRFELAQMEIQNADAIFTANPDLETYCIPGTDSLIRPTSKNDETWMKIKEKCLAYHQPDAICCHPDCNYVAKPYVIPNKNIFLKDPAFNGMVIVNCNNENQSCALKFHQYCWKMKKDELYPISKVSDKDMVGMKCFTPNCLNDDTACVISSIQIIDQNGELKAHIKENPSTTWSVNSHDKNEKNNKNDKSASKGAIKKYKVTTSTLKKADNPSSGISVMQQQLLDSIAKSKNTTPAANVIHSEDDVQYYDETQVIVVKDKVVEVDFSHEPPEIAGEKSFLLSLLLDYIKKNHVRICDVYAKFNEYNEDLHLKDLDVLGFLLQTNNFEVLSSIETPFSPTVYTDEVVNQPHDNFKAKSYDDDCTSFIDDVYHELMNEREDRHITEDTDPIKNYNFNVQDLHFNSHLNNNYQNQYSPNTNGFVHESAGSGDASEHLKNIGNTISSPLFESHLKFDGFQTQNSSTENENNKLKNYISKLESDMEKIIDENDNLRKKIVERDSNLESFRREQEYCQNKIKQCEQLFETMTDFQKGYDNMKEENFKIKEELVRIMKEKNDLETKVKEVQDPEAKRTEFMKFFQEEYQLLQKAVNEEWENKADILKKSLKAEIETKMALLNKLLNVQYSSNQHVLTRYCDQCFDFLEVTEKVNAWAEKNLNLKNVLNNSEWLTRKELLQKAVNQLQSDYSSSLKELHSEKEEKFKMTDINLKSPAIPSAPIQKLSDVVLNALSTCYRHQYQMMQSYVLKAQTATQAAMQYQSHPTSQSQTGYVPQYHYGSLYPNAQPVAPATSFLSPNLTLQQASPVVQPSSPSASSPAPASVESKNTQETPKTVGNEQISQSKTNDIQGSWNTVKEEVKVEKKAANEPDKIDTFKDKLAQMKEAFKSIALNVKEKSNTEKSTDSEHKEIKNTPVTFIRDDHIKLEKTPEKVPAPTTAEIVKNTFEKLDSATNGETTVQTQNTKDAVSVRDDRSDITTLTTKNDSKSQKKVGMDGLVKVLLQQFPGAMECDVIEAIAKIRKARKNTLTGIPVNRIIEEAKPHIQQSQRSRQCPNL